MTVSRLLCLADTQESISPRGNIHLKFAESSTHRGERLVSLTKSSSIVGIMTLASRVLGFVRDQVMAIVFGAGALTDVFLVAFKIPNFLRRLFAEGAFAQAFVPVFTEYKETKSHEALRELAAHVLGTLTVILLVISTLGVMLAPLLVMLFAPGFIDDPERFDLATHMLRITFLCSLCRCWPTLAVSRIRLVALQCHRLHRCCSTFA